MTEKTKKSWYKRWWAITFFTLIGIGILSGIFGGANTPSPSNSNIQAQVLEMTTQQIFNEFEGLSDIQIDEKIKEFEGKRIQTSIYVSKIDKASLSSQYVAMEMYEYPYNLMPYVKAFFSAEEKDSLLNANIGDTLVLSGEFVTYKKGGLTSYIEFTKSKVIEINS
ncbi:MAG: hypothetical protein AAB910_02200 [Patescibacteria group bacterium]